MTFNIRNQTAGQINNVGGNQYVTGPQHNSVATAEFARGAARDLRNSVPPTDPATARRAGAELDEIDAGLGGARPDRSRVAQALGRLTGLLSAAGALATAGAALLDPLRALAGWLGALGVPVLQMLSGTI